MNVTESWERKVACVSSISGLWSQRPPVSLSGGDMREGPLPVRPQQEPGLPADMPTLIVSIKSLAL